MSVPIWDHDLAKLRQELSRESLQCLIPATSTNRFVSLNDFAFGALGSFGEDEAVQMILILLLFYAVFCCFLLVFLIDSGWMVWWSQNMCQFPSPGFDLWLHNANTLVFVRYRDISCGCIAYLCSGGGSATVSTGWRWPTVKWRTMTEPFKFLITWSVRST